MQKKQLRFATDNVLYSQQVKDFLSKFKVFPCTIKQVHYDDLCPNYHSNHDRRRNPYNGHNMSYYPAAEQCLCGNENCRVVHNYYEYCFHPFNYKTSQCTNSYCHLQLICNSAHPNQILYLQKNGFFRFDLQTFKTIKCPITHSNNSEFASCRFYHVDGDRRRDHTQINYSHLQCGYKTNCTNKLCQYSHNKIEQLYHPQRYKSKYCVKILKKMTCEYLQFCSFAHYDHQLTIQLIHKITVKDEHFMCYKYKTIWCPFTDTHERGQCVYAHNFNDYRRDPLRFKYQAGQCHMWNKVDNIVSLDDCGCPYKLDCIKCHGWFENKYHVSNFTKHTQAIQEEKLNPKNSEPQKNEQAYKKQDGLGTGAPFFKPEQKKESRPSSKQNQHKSQPKKETQEQKLKEDNSLNRNSSSNKILAVKKTKSVQKPTMLLFQKQEKKIWLQKNQMIIEAAQNNTNKSSPTKSNILRKKRINQSQSNKNSYTSSFKKLIAQYGLEEKILGLGIHQFSLLDFDQQEITNGEYFNKLSQEEKQMLFYAVSKYNREPTHLRYSHSLKSIFKRRQQQGILEKMHTKKISQKKLLGLSHNSINQLSFLGQQQKQKLPVILQNYIEQHREFKEINDMIKIQTIPPA